MSRRRMQSTKSAAKSNLFTNRVRYSIKQEGVYNLDQILQRPAYSVRYSPCCTHILMTPPYDMISSWLLAYPRQGFPLSTARN